MRTLLISHTSPFPHVYDMLWLFCEAKWSRTSNPAVCLVKYPPHPLCRTCLSYLPGKPPQPYSCCGAGMRLRLNLRINCNNCKTLYYFPNIIYCDFVCNPVALHQPAAAQLSPEAKLSGYWHRKIKHWRRQVCSAPTGTVKKASKKVKIWMCKTKKIGVFSICVFCSFRS